VRKHAYRQGARHRPGERERWSRTRLLQALHSKEPEAIKQAKADAIKAGYSNAAVGAIGRTPSDVFLFSKLPEADQQAILRTPEEFERYIGHAHMKLRKPNGPASGWRRLRLHRARHPAQAQRHRLHGRHHLSCRPRDQRHLPHQEGGRGQTTCCARARYRRSDRGAIRRMLVKSSRFRSMSYLC
jgi:hypothetical protein